MYVYPLHIEIFLNKRFWLWNENKCQQWKVI